MARPRKPIERTRYVLGAGYRVHSALPDIGNEMRRLRRLGVGRELLIERTNHLVKPSIHRRRVREAVERVQAVTGLVYKLWATPRGVLVRARAAPVEPVEPDPWE